MGRGIDGFGVYYQNQINAISTEIHELKNEKIPKLEREMSAFKFALLAVIILFVIFILAMLSGCSGYSPDSGGSMPYSVTNEGKIRDWQQRQKNISVVPEYKNTEPTGDLFEDICFIVQRLPYIERWEDIDLFGIKDYWQTSQETFDRLKGDCEDMSILVYIVLLDSGLLDYYNADIFIRWVVYEDNTSHAFCYVQSEDGQIVCISNLWVYEGFVESWSRIVADFDLYSIYWGGIKI